MEAVPGDTDAVDDDVSERNAKRFVEVTLHVPD